MKDGKKFGRITGGQAMWCDAEGVPLTTGLDAVIEATGDPGKLKITSEGQTGTVNEASEYQITAPLPERTGGKTQDTIAVLKRCCKDIRGKTWTDSLSKCRYIDLATIGLEGVYETTDDTALVKVAAFIEHETCQMWGRAMDTPTSRLIPILN